MSRNIKEIGKELLGKSLNSFHRKTGLTQLEENNKMQDGILDGILSQVDDAYIEKTEQSNVMHLEGSGDGVVVLDSIGGNTMVNLFNVKQTYNGLNASLILLENGYYELSIPSDGDYTTCEFELNNAMFKNSTKYTIIADIKENTLENIIRCDTANNYIFSTATCTLTDSAKQTGRIVQTWISQSDITKQSIKLKTMPSVANTKIVFRLTILEGDLTNKEINYFEGLQSSFEEQVEEDKYKIEILSQNENIFNIDSANTNHIVQNNGNLSSNSAWVLYDYEPIAPLQNIVVSEKYVNGRYFQYKMCYYDKDKKFISAKDLTGYDGYKIDITPMGAKYFRLNHSIAVNGNSVTREEIMVSYGTTYRKEYIPYKQNKIKLLINEPLRAVDNAKDRLCVKDGKLTIERNTFLHVLNGQEIWNINDSLNTSNTTRYYTNTLTIPMTLNSNGISDKIPYITGGGKDNMTCIYIHSTVNRIDIRKLNTDNRWTTLEELKTWLRNNNVTLVLKRLEAVYEEVLNEYGEPILLEGYENGTLYIDSAIVPTTTVRYTPKMESFKTLKDVENNNIMLTNDVNDNIIPYMMDVDLMIMEKEMALMSHKNIRKMEVLDMTSMQKRTQDMLERLIKGKTLTVQECKTRVTTYLNAGKITDEQAEELMLLIDEIYA